VLFEQRKPLAVEDVELEGPRAGEVLVRMAASGVCHSCLHAADGSWAGVRQRARAREDLPRPANLYMAGKLKLGQLITRRYGLDEANEASGALAAGELARGLIVF
jgi:Zn-dependent alcohol dehydrogenase